MKTYEVKLKLKNCVTHIRAFGHSKDQAIKDAQKRYIGATVLDIKEIST